MEWWILSQALFLFVVSCTLHYSTSSSNTGYYRDFVFDSNPDHILSLALALVNGTQMTTKVADKMDCVFACTRNRPWCRSVNFKTQAENDSQHICELLSTDTYTNPSYLKPAQGFTHLSIRNKCMNCHGNAVCIPDYDNDDYTCVAIGCEKLGFEMFCPDGKLLRIKWALYGRSSRDVCIVGPMKVPCGNETSSLTKVKGQCEGKQSCSFTPGLSWYGGDPCRTYAKYIEVQYSC